MLNHLYSASGEALEARRAINTELRLRLRELPAAPFTWSDFDACAALGSANPASDPHLAALAGVLCNAPARTAELQSLWCECVVTAAFAARLAPRLGGDPATSAMAGLLHRAGDMLVLRAIGAAEHAMRVRLDAPSRAEICAFHGIEQIERLVRAWAVPPRAATIATEWRRLREFPAAAADAAALYLARLCSLQAISPQFCAPGVLEHAMEEAGLAPESLDDLRQDAALAALPRSWESCRVGGRLSG